MTAICKICKSEVTSPIVGLSAEERSVEIGKMMLEHMGSKHLTYMKNLAVLTRTFTGFIVMNRFIVNDPDVENEKEVMRDMLAERLMQDAPDNEDEEDEEDEDNNFEDNPQEGEYLNEPADLEINEPNESKVEVKKRRKTQEVEPITAHPNTI